MVIGGVKVVDVGSTSRGDGPVGLISQLRSLQNFGWIPTVPGQSRRKGGVNTRSAHVCGLFHRKTMHNL